MNMDQFNLLKHRILIDMHDDDIGLWWVIGVVKEIYGQRSDEDVRIIISKIIFELLKDGLIRAGQPRLLEGKWESTFEEWGMDARQTIDRIEDEWKKLKHKVTLGDVVWFRTTEKGDQYLKDNKLL